ncbi:aldose epimerase family protein [candidate division KSB1 bacterium]
MTINYLGLISVAALVVVILGNCDSTMERNIPKNSITRQPFGKTPEGMDVDLYTLTNANGLQATVTNYGTILTSLKVPDRDGNFADIVLGYENLDGYIQDTYYFGCTAGRFAGRIAEGKFTLDGVEYQLKTNNGPNHLHGGIKGFNKRVWNGKVKQSKDGPSLKLTYTSKDGEEGYPGNLACTVVYTLTDENELKISFQATTDKPTICNLTHHSYFNLAGHNSGDILDHELTVFADYYAPAEPDWLIPTGEIRSVKGTAVDFTVPTRIGARLTQAPADHGGNNDGYDLNYVLKNSGNPDIAARVYEPKSGRVLEVFTSEPALQVYTSNFIDGAAKGKGMVYQKYAGLCLEPEHFPNSPNKPHLPSVVLRQGKVYQHMIVYKFSTK